MGFRNFTLRFSLGLGVSAAHVDLQSVQERMSIQQLLLKGHVQKARAKLVQMDPQVWCNFNLVDLRSSMVNNG